MQLELHHKIVMVTGAARRVGKAIALAFARQGAHLIIHHSQSPDEAEQTAAEIRALGVQALVIQGDHSQHSEIVRNFAEIQQHYGRLDVLVNSASIFEKKDFLEVTPEEWHTVMDINLSAPFWCTQHAGRLMRDQHIPGCIINIGDNGGLRPWVQRPHHGISKAGVIMLTQVTAKALAQYQIRANCIVPGPVLKSPDMTDDYWQNVVEARLPLKRSGTPEDVAQAAVFLAQNDFITGAILRVDGGEYLA